MSIERVGSTTSDHMVAVILPAYNEPISQLKQSIDSILNQTWKDLRLYFILDNPSNEEIRQLAHQYEAEHENFLFSENESNLGLVGTLNRALGMTREPYIARMDADDISIETRIQREMEFMTNNNLSFVMSGANYLEENGAITEGRRLPDLLTPQMAEAHKYATLSIHPSWLAKRSVFEGLNGYRDVHYCEDIDFLLRALQQGVPTGRIGESLLLYRLSSASISHSHSREQLARARFLQEAYARGESLEAIDPATLNQRFLIEKNETIKTAHAKAKLDQLALALNQRRWGRCLALAASGCLTSRMFRHELAIAIRERVQIDRICKQAEECCAPKSDSTNSIDEH